jgi:hypothetical protein
MSLLPIVKIEALMRETLTGARDHEKTHFPTEWSLASKARLAHETSAEKTS